MEDLATFVAVCQYCCHSCTRNLIWEQQRKEMNMGCGSREWLEWFCFVQCLVEVGCRGSQSLNLNQ